MKTYSPFSIAFLRALIITARPYTLFFPALVALLALKMSGHPSTLLNWIHVTLLALGYGFGQILTDVFETDTDRLSSPYRPLVRGAVKRRHFFYVALTALFSIALWFFLHNILSGLFFLFLIGVWRIYAWSKHFWFLGAFLKSLVPPVLFLCAFYINGEPPSPAVLSWLMGTLTLGHFSYKTLGSFKDISADRATQCKTLPIRIGWMPTILLSLIATGATLFFTLNIFGSAAIDFSAPISLTTGVSFLLSGAGGLFMILAHTKMAHIAPEEQQAFRSIEFALRGLILLHVGILVTLTPELLSFGVGFYLVFEVVFNSRPDRSQI